MHNSSSTFQFHIRVLEDQQISNWQPAHELYFSYHSLQRLLTAAGVKIYENRQLRCEQWQEHEALRDTSQHVSYVTTVRTRLYNHVLVKLYGLDNVRLSCSCKPLLHYRCRWHFEISLLYCIFKYTHDCFRTVFFFFISASKFPCRCQLQVSLPITNFFLETMYI